MKNYTLKQAAKRLGISPSTLRRRVREGYLPAEKLATKFGTKWVIPREAVEQLQSLNTLPGAWSDSDEHHKSAEATSMEPVGATGLPDGVPGVPIVESLEPPGSTFGAPEATPGLFGATSAPSRLEGAPEPLLESLRLCQNLQAAHQDAEARAARAERQALLLQVELRRSQLALTEHAESLHEKRAEARCQALQEARADLEQHNLKQVEAFESERSQLTEQLREARTELEQLKQRQRPWWSRLFGT